MTIELGLKAKREAMTEETVDREKRTGWIYSPKPPSDELRQKLSDAMKAFHRKTGKGTLSANRAIALRRKAKGKQ